MLLLPAATHDCSMHNSAALALLYLKACMLDSATRLMSQ
jgi:hypothetical protein